MMNEEDRIIIDTHNRILEIFNTVKNESEEYPEYDDFKEKFSDLLKQSFPRFEESRLIQLQHGYYDQKFIVDFVVNTIPIKLTNDIHGIGPSIMIGILSNLSCRIGIVINITDYNPPEFIPVQNPQF